MIHTKDPISGLCLECHDEYMKESVNDSDYYFNEGNELQIKSDSLKYLIQIVLRKLQCVMIRLQVSILVFRNYIMQRGMLYSILMFFVLIRNLGRNEESHFNYMNGHITNKKNIGSYHKKSEALRCRSSKKKIFHLKKFEEAIKCDQEKLKIDPNCDFQNEGVQINYLIFLYQIPNIRHVFIFNNYKIRTIIQQGNINQAIQFFEDSLKKKPDSEYLLQMGQ